MTGLTAIARVRLARMIDDTLLEPEAADDDVARLAKEAEQLGTHAICVSPSRLPLAEGVLAPWIRLAAVVGFPSGAHPVAVKAAEAAAAVGDGASEIDMVIDLGTAMDNRRAMIAAGATRIGTSHAAAISNGAISNGAISNGVHDE
jgi:deoxyribose-phosphate aldolase